jgi:hypothetical protein
MNGAQPQKTHNNLVATTRMAGVASRAGDMSQLQQCAKALGKAGGSLSAASNGDLGNKPSQLPHLTTRKTGNEEGTQQRGITQERPARGHSR